jgi:hypothetical protein
VELDEKEQVEVGTVYTTLWSRKKIFQGLLVLKRGDDIFLMKKKSDGE